MLDENPSQKMEIASLQISQKINNFTKAIQNRLLKRRTWYLS